jgi:hypothetical protein
MISRFAKIKKSGQHLSVSLPTSIPQDVLTKTASLSDMIHIMAYGKTDIASMQRKTEKFKDIKRDKISLALRPRDFQDEYAMERFIDQISSVIGIKNISIHDFEQYNDMCAGEVL